MKDIELLTIKIMNNKISIWVTLLTSKERFNLILWQFEMSFSSLDFIFIKHINRKLILIC